MIEFPPTQAQIDAADALRIAGLATSNTEQAWSRALDQLSEAVTAAHAAGIPRKDAQYLAGSVGSAATGEKFRAMLRRTYRWNGR